ncbi:hypothetical protein [Streptantibioticus cattleyicolor]|uniref:hypothetical protein n=1 Tax=Streptantibioticus cattleyicolor TaxID=29303 RepID=UPI000AFA6B99|nr:hypothetical protein [Streptantibioticus cattleyicolor]
MVLGRGTLAGLAVAGVLAGQVVGGPAVSAAEPGDGPVPAACRALADAWSRLPVRHYRLPAGLKEEAVGYVTANLGRFLPLLSESRCHKLERHYADEHARRALAAELDSSWDATAGPGCAKGAEATYRTVRRELPRAQRMLGPDRLTSAETGLLDEAWVAVWRDLAAYGHPAPRCRTAYLKVARKL